MPHHNLELTQLEVPKQNARMFIAKRDVGAAMSMSRIMIVSSVGTSLLTNGVSSDTRTFLNNHANARSVDLSEDAKRELDAIISRAKTEVENASAERLRVVSAEINTILARFGSPLALQGTHHLLVVTDTAQGKATAELIADILERWGASVDTRAVTDLTTSDPDRFRMALADLARTLSEDLPAFRRRQFRIVFNLTGGFKPVQGFLQSFASLHADETIYIFERSTRVMSIPRLPIALDAYGAFGSDLVPVRRLAGGLAISEPLAIPETLLFELDGAQTLSEWGAMLWGLVRDTEYGKSIQPPISARLVFAKSFLADCDGLTEDRLRKLNRHLDELAIFLEHPIGEGPSGLRFKQLKGNPVPGCTHQFNAWSDGEPRRCHGRYLDDGRFEVVQLVKKLPE